MFTGIITHIGQIDAITPIASAENSGVRVAIQVEPSFLVDVALGDSIAIQGACMTVVQKKTDHFEVEVSHESLQRTVGLAQPGYVNLEKAMRPMDRLGGHFVTGHVDGLGKVAAFEPIAESICLQIEVPPSIAHYMAYKGSVTINGVSLTVNEVVDSAEYSTISMNLIPHTVQHTTLQYLQVGAAVNIEIDVLARYLDRQFAYSQQSHSQ